MQLVREDQRIQSIPVHEPDHRLAESGAAFEARSVLRVTVEVDGPFGRSMNFTLPAMAQGPSIEAEVDGAAIVFPLGPRIALSWADCRLEVGSDRTKLYRCELKPQYRFE